MFGRKQTKKIGLFTAMSFAIGAMIGGGVFVLSGVALGQTGPSALLSFLIAGVIVLLSALSFAAIAAQAKKDESGYAAVGVILNAPIWGFMTSWCFYLAAIIGAAFVLDAFGIYMYNFVSQSLPVLGWSLLAAVGLVLLNLGPASTVGKIERLLVVGKLAVLVALIVAGVLHISSDDFHPFLTHGSSGLFEATSYLFIAFLGFNVITSISGEVDKPQKTVPRAILYSMLIVTLVYCGVVIALLAAPTSTYTEASVGDAAEQLIGPVGGGLVIFGALIATLSAANANILGSSEIMVRLALRKQVPTIFGHMHRGNPYVSVLFGAVGYIVLLLSGQTETVIGLANVMAIAALVIVNAAAIRLLRKKRGGWILPSLGIVGALSQFIFLPKTTLLIGAALFATGVLVYAARHRFFYGHLHRQIKQRVDTDKTPLKRALR